MSFGAPIAQSVRRNATREEKLAALPPYPRSLHGKVLEERLDNLAQAARGSLDLLDRVLEEVSEEFAQAFAKDDARAATQARITQAAKQRRDAKRNAR